MVSFTLKIIIVHDITRCFIDLMHKNLGFEGIRADVFTNFMVSEIQEVKYIETESGGKCEGCHIQHIRGLQPEVDRPSELQFHNKHTSSLPAAIHWELG